MIRHAGGLSRVVVLWLLPDDGLVIVVVNGQVRFAVEPIADV